ncbi:unnamed protein product [Urochloa humidicola]
MAVVLELGLVLLLVVPHCPAATALPSLECRRQCGDVEIRYPFGIGMNCSLAADLDVTCQPDQNGFSKVQTIHWWPRASQYFLDQ